VRAPHRYAGWRDELTVVRMLYAFHVDQNKRRPGSVHATYMLIGYRRAPGARNSPGPDEDAAMISSPFNSTQRDDKESEEKCVVVVSQEKLEGAQQVARNAHLDWSSQVHRDEIAAFPLG
jgi:DNA polymerase delta subunit 3